MKSFHKVLSSAGIAIVFATTLAGCINTQQRVDTSLINAPSWFIQRSISAADGEVVGFGAGTNLDKAKANALADIASQIYVNVSANVELTATTHSSSKASFSSSQSTSLSTKYNLQGAKEVKKQINENGVYVVYSYQPEHWLQRALTLLPTTYCDELSLQKSNAYLAQTAFYSHIENSLNCIPDFTLWTDEHQWFLSYGNTSQVMSENFDDLFFAKIENAALHIDLSSNHVNHNELYFISYHSARNGFLSILQISPLGDTQVLIENQPIKSKTKYRFPDSTKYQGLAAVYDANNKTNSPVNNLVLAMVCDERALFPNVQHVNSVSASGSKSILPALFNQIESCNTATQLMTIHSNHLSTAS